MLSIFNWKKPAADTLSFLKTDIHSHLLPGIDDGSTDMERTINYIEELHKLGYKKFITTPHVKAGIFPNTPAIINNALNEVREAIKPLNLDIEIEAAAEYLLDEEFESILQRNELLSFGTKRYLLIEMSFISPPPNLSQLIFKLKTSGYSPVMAHPERYPYWWESLDKIADLKQAGCLLQLNLLSLAGYYGKKTKQVATKLLESGIIDFVGTDLHHERHLADIQLLTKDSKLMKLLKNKAFLNEML
ncbi:tyrosine-protein phosphatase [Emticicia sp. TH156]|uniref:tyrosine-protein phosphatase n=1 Tax=Emticicia sp. TH156 TaxID=2067454 RepID=UPI000C787D2A|nr:CpsB/CapC family capsule biosynthesis tyrosine phosphatase [Emticicia sp. TH156]PLK44020.1 histidinol phosphatase [Emticicia sp. TH156]